MRRVISSGWTALFKAVVPLVFMALSIFLVLILCVYSPKLDTDWLMVVFLMVGATVFFCWWGVKLKRVSVDDRNLYVSNLVKEILIPLSEVDAVEDYQGGWPVIIRLKAESEFGRTIFFLATWNPFQFSRHHPVVEELRQMIRDHT